MARPVEFDREDALERALKLFWCQGYAATSLAQLLDEMQISRSSFYASFGDKRALFVEVLTLFAVRTRGILWAARQEAGPLEAIRRFFHATLIEVPRYRAARGCLMVNTILESKDVDAGLSELATRELAGVETLFETFFDEAQRGGWNPNGRSAADWAAHVMLLNQGFRVTSRTPATRREIEKQLDTALSLLNLPAA